MAQLAEKLQPWLATLDERPRGGSRWLQDLRDHAASRFVELGFPTVRDEEWRFTNVSPIASTEFKLAPVTKLAPEALGTFLWADAPFRLVVVNGRVAPELSRTSGIPAGMRFGSLATAATEHPDIVGRYLGKLADPDTRAFAALNTAFTNDGAYVYIPDGLIFEQPLQILFVSTGEGTAPTMSHPRALVVAGDRSQVQIVETYVSAPGQKHFTNAVTEIVAGENAVIDHYKIEEESIDAFHIASMHINAARSSNVSTHAFTLGGRIVRNDIIAVLDGEGAECTLNGLYVADGERLVDTHTTIDHAKAHCPSHEVYKGILGGRAACRLQRQDHRAHRRAEDRREADQSRAAALGQRDDQHQAAARDLCRRREVHARRGHRSARRRRDFLPPGSRPDLSRGARHADSRFCRRDPRSRQDRAAARGARSGALRTAGA